MFIRDQPATGMRAHAALRAGHLYANPGGLSRLPRREETGDLVVSVVWLWRRGMFLLVHRLSRDNRPDWRRLDGELHGAR
jgi:hypothetical protein